MKRGRSAVGLVALVFPLAIVGLSHPSAARAARAAHVARVAHVARTAHVAPDGPPLVSSVAPGSAASTGSGEATAAAPPSGGDVLSGNGLNSPFCREPADLDPATRRNCARADFSGAPFPTGDYAFDVNIDTGLSSWGNYASSVIQGFVQMAWMWLVAVAHGLIVMLEWCYSLNPVNRQLLSQVAAQLRGVGLDFTRPWLALALSVASMLAVYRGLLLGRALDASTRALTTLAMMALGLWLMSDAAGTIGSLGAWADEAAAGTLAVGASGSPARPRAALAGHLEGVFGAVVRAPWCYLEFGNVGWCDAPDRLDGRLRAVALRAARRLQSESECSTDCANAVDARGRAQALAASLLREAHTNGELFLALPANRLRRNSVKTPDTLLNTLCGGGPSADDCRGPTAAVAEFRSENGTYGRLIGVLLIWAGALGLLLLFGFLGVRLLLAAVVTVTFLLLTPGVVLLPAFGERGANAFRAWGVRLLEAAVSKLAYSFAMGVVLGVTGMLLKLTVLGWWAQWLLVSAFWWGSFTSRHRMFGVFAAGWGRAEAGTTRTRPSRWRPARASHPGGRAGNVARAVRRAAARPPEPPAMPRLEVPVRPHPSASAATFDPRSSDPSSPDVPADGPSKLDEQLAAEVELREQARRRIEEDERRRWSPVMEDIKAWAESWQPGNTSNRTYVLDPRLVPDPDPDTPAE